MGYTGEGDDYMGTKKDGLRFSWRWSYYLDDPDPKDDKPNQVCCADWKDYMMKSIAWGNGFSATLSYQQSFAHDHPFIAKEGFKTRLEAQKGAELLLIEHLKKQCALHAEVQNL